MQVLEAASYEGAIPLVQVVAHGVEAHIDMPDHRNSLAQRAYIVGPVAADATALIEHLLFASVGQASGH